MFFRVYWNTYRLFLLCKHWQSSWIHANFRYFRCCDLVWICWECWGEPTEEDPVIKQIVVINSRLSHFFRIFTGLKDCKLPLFLVVIKRFRDLRQNWSTDSSPPPPRKLARQSNIKTTSWLVLWIPMFISISLKWSQETCDKYCIYGIILWFRNSTRDLSSYCSTATGPRFRYGLRFLYLLGRGLLSRLGFGLKPFNMPHVVQACRSGRTRSMVSAAVNRVDTVWWHSKPWKTVYVMISQFKYNTSFSY